jgi:dTDP-4-dehydrorhamnose reductase
VTVLVTGGSGQLGRALQALLPDARVHDRSLDVTSRDALQAYDWDGITAIVNAAAWTAVDRAEVDVLPAWDVNVTGVAHLAWHARRLGIPLVHVSTDYVFRGDHEGEAAVDGVLDPQGAYGITKAAGELAARIAPRHYVVRTSWVFGDGPNFVRTMRRLAADRSELTVVDDQLGRPTYAVDLAEALVRLLDGDLPPGTYHGTGGGPVVSWAGFASAVLEGTGCRVLPVTTEQYRQGAPATAPRPMNSALAAGPLQLRDWRLALRDYLERERA